MEFLVVRMAGRACDEFGERDFSKSDYESLVCHREIDIGYQMLGDLKSIVDFSLTGCYSRFAFPHPQKT